jgi:hypothetical protein
MELGQAQQKPSAAELRREISELRQAVLKCVLDDPVALPDLPLLQEFKTEHARLRAEIAAAEDCISRLQAARDEYLSVFGRFNTAKCEYEQSKRALAKLYKPLGVAAFAAFKAREIPRQQEFFQRIALEERIASLEKEHDALAARPDAGIVEKAKASAQQFALAAKIKVEQLSTGKMDAEIGRGLIDYEREKAVRSESTAEVVDEAVAARGETTCCKHDLDLAAQSLTTTTEALSQALGFPQIEGKNTFDAAIRSVQKQIKEKQRRLSTREREIPDSLAANPSAFADTPIGPKLTRLVVLLAEARPTPARPGAWMAVYESLTPGKRIAIGAACAFGLVLFLGLRSWLASPLIPSISPDTTTQSLNPATSTVVARQTNGKTVVGPNASATRSGTATPTVQSAPVDPGKPAPMITGPSADQSGPAPVIVGQRGTPVDTNDKAACRNELAELSCFRFTITRGEQTVFDNNPFHDDPSTVRALDCCVRLGRLAACNDEGLKNAAVEVQTLQSDLWQILRANHDFGATRRQRDAAMTSLLQAGLVRTLDEVLVEMSRPEPDKIEYKDANGQHYYVNGPDKPADPEVVAKFNAQFYEAAKQAQQWMKQTEETSLLLMQVEFHRHDRLAEVWKNVLIPKFRSTTTPSKRPLFKARMVPHGKFDNFATIQNVSGRDLHHVAVEFQADDAHGHKPFWYGYVAVLPPDATIQLTTNGSKSFADPSVWFEATACMFCDEGSNDHVQLKPRRGRTDHENIVYRKFERDNQLAIAAVAPFADQALQTIRTIYKAPQNPIPARARLLSVLKEGHSYLTRVRRGDNPMLLVLYLDKLDINGSMTKATVQLQTPHQSVADTFLGRIVEEVDRGCVMGFVGLTPPNFQTALDAKHQILGRLKSMPQYAPAVRGESEPRSKTRRGRRGRPSPSERQKLPPGQYGPLVHKLEDELNSKTFLDKAKTLTDDHLKSWQNGDIWLVTTPWEIRDLRMPSHGFWSTLSGPIRDEDRKTWHDEEERVAHSEPAKYVLFVNKSGEIMVQTPTAYDDTRRVGLFKLTDIGTTPRPTTTPAP